MSWTDLVVFFQDPAYPTERIQQCMAIAKPVAWVSLADAGDLKADLAVRGRTQLLPLCSVYLDSFSFAALLF